MMSLAFVLFTQVCDSGSHSPLVYFKGGCFILIKLIIKEHDIMTFEKKMI